MWIGVISLFPEMFQAVTDYGVTGRAVSDGILAVQYWNPRQFTKDKHQTVDDRPYGGGPGMLMKTLPLRKAIHTAKESAKQQGLNNIKVVYLSPQGQVFNQQVAGEMAGREGLILVSGRYEGIDERVIESEIDEQWSIGDYVLTGGELPAMVVIDAISRLLPGVLGHEQSADQDSFSMGLLDYPHYTRPENDNGQQVPEILLSGHHEMIRCWRLKQALGNTYTRRPELLSELELTAEQQKLLDEYLSESLNSKNK